MNKLSQFKGFLLSLIFTNSSVKLSNRATKTLSAFEQTKAQLKKVIEETDKLDAELEVKRQKAYKKYAEINKAVMDEQDSLAKLTSQNVKVLRNIETLVG
jgi:septal ring factor EnvC (AmiA/AmiB activator)